MTDAQENYGCNVTGTLQKNANWAVILSCVSTTPRKLFLRWGIARQEICKNEKLAATLPWRPCTILLPSRGFRQRSLRSSSSFIGKDRSLQSIPVNWSIVGPPVLVELTNGGAMNTQNLLFSLGSVRASLTCFSSCRFASCREPLV